MMAPEPKEKESVEVRGLEREKPAVKDIKDKNQERELQSMVLRVGKCQYTGASQNVVLKIRSENNMRL
jgi:hypothetical protein